MNSFSELPGFEASYTKMLASLYWDRDVAWVIDEDRLCGFRIKPLTVLGVHDLRVGENRFIHGGKLSADDVFDFLWRCSPHYKRGRRFNFWRSLLKACLAWKILRRGLPVLGGEVCEYLKRVLESDVKQIPEGKKSVHLVASPLAYKLDFAMSRYSSMTAEVVFEMPIQLYHQLERVATFRSDPETCNRPPFDDFLKEQTKLIQAKLDAEKEAKSDGE